MYEVKIGSYEQKSDQVIVSDPSYDYDPREHMPNSKLMKLNVVIINVMKGNWNAYVTVLENEKDRNAELISIHENENICYIKENQWIKIDEIGVDSGQAGIYDLKYFQNLPKYTKDSWYKMNSEITLKEPNYAGVIPHGAVSSSGYGDGLYPVYIIKNKNGKITAIKINFIFEEESQETL